MKKSTVARTCIVTLEFSLVYDNLVDPIYNLRPMIAFQSPIPHPLPL